MEEKNWWNDFDLGVARNAVGWSDWKILQINYTYCLETRGLLEMFLLFGFLDFSNFKHNVIAGNLNISVLLVFETHRVIGGEKTLP